MSEETCPTPEQIAEAIKDLSLKHCWGILKLEGKGNLAFEAIRRCQNAEEVQAVVNELERELTDASSGTRRKWKRAAEARINSLQGQTTT